MSVKRIGMESLTEFCKRALIKNGMSEKNAALTSEALVFTDAFGVHSHGTKNLHPYIRKMEAGALDPAAEPELIHEGGAVAVMDARDCMGMVAGARAMDEAAALAKKNGIGFVTVKNSCHFGAGSYYVYRAAREGMLGIAMSNTDPNMVVPGGKGMTLGNNPLAFAFPCSGRRPVLLDIALSATAALKINRAKQYHESIPDTWMVDPEGRPTTDPQYYQNGGALLPVGSHKGYGLSMLVEALSALASGGRICRDVKSWCFDLTEKNRVCHAFLALDVDRIRPGGGFGDQAADYVGYIKASPKAQGTERLFVPGEMEWGRYEDACANGVELPGDVVESLELLSRESGLELKDGE